MRKLHWYAIAVTLAVMFVVAGSALAQPTIDGNASVADGYTLLSTQNTDTRFGNADQPDLIASGGGSELDQVFGKIENGRLYMVLAGNLEINFNKMHVFIDSVAGGVNQIDGDEFTPEDNNVPFGLDRFCCGGFPPPDGNNTDNIGALQKMDTFKFDDGVEADYALVFSHGKETVGADLPINPINFYAINAHYADLTQGTDGDVVAAGIQLGPQGINQVMRISPADFQNDFDVDGADFLRWQRNVGTVDVGGNEVPLQSGNSDRDDDVDADDLATWKSRYGTDREITDQSFTPFGGGPQTTDLLFGGQLPGLSQGDLIDKNYALGSDGGCTGDSTDGNAGCAVPELEFVLPVDTNDAGNTLNHRDFDNTIDLKLAIDNSNNAGVNQSDGPEFANTGDPETVTTGIEFSIPLSEIGSPAELSELKIVAFVNSSSFEFSSNQYAGDGVLQSNLENFSAGIDLSTIDGDQFVTLAVPGPPAISAVPEPTSAVLLLLGAMGVLFRRRS